MGHSLKLLCVSSSLFFSLSVEVPILRGGGGGGNTGGKWGKAITHVCIMVVVLSTTESEGKSIYMILPRYYY